MKILQFKARNVKGLRLVELNPDGSDVVLSGGNGAGKSSVLDAITTTLAGGTLPIRNGADKGEVEIELGPYTITRSITARTDRVVVRSKDGTALGEPKTMLKRLVGPLAIDPVAFCTLKSRDQVDLLFDLLPGLRKKLAALDARTAEYKAERAAINAELARQVAWPEEDPALPEQPIDYWELDDKRKKTQRQIANVRLAAQERTSLEEQIAEQRVVVEEAQAKLLELEGRLNNCPEPKTSIKELNRVYTELDAQVATAIETNERIAERNRVRTLQVEAKEKRDRYNSLLIRMKEVEAEKADLLGSAKLPLRGLSVDESGVYYKGVVVQDLSTAERVKVGAAVAVAQNPQAKIILADDASLLDSKSLAVLKETCKGFQIWTVVNDESGRSGVWIEDGSVRED